MSLALSPKISYSLVIHLTSVSLPFSIFCCLLLSLSLFLSFDLSLSKVLSCLLSLSLSHSLTCNLFSPSIAFYFSFSFLPLNLYHLSLFHTPIVSRSLLAAHYFSLLLSSSFFQHFLSLPHFLFIPLPHPLLCLPEGLFSHSLFMYLYVCFSPTHALSFSPLHSPFLALPLVSLPLLS